MGIKKPGNVIAISRYLSDVNRKDVIRSCLETVANKITISNDILVKRKIT